MIKSTGVPALRLTADLPEVLTEAASLVAAVPSRLTVLSLSASTISVALSATEVSVTELKSASPVIVRAASAVPPARAPEMLVTSVVLKSAAKPPASVTSVSPVTSTPAIVTLSATSRLICELPETLSTSVSANAEPTCLLRFTLTVSTFLTVPNAKPLSPVRVKVSASVVLESLIASVPAA